MKKKKILYVVSSLRKSGPIIVLENIIKHLDRNKYDVEIVKLSVDEVGRSITEVFKSMGVTIHELGFTKLQLELFPMKVAKKIETLIDEYGYDIIHTHGYQAVVVVSKIKKDIVKMETLHCISGEDYVQSKGIILGNYMNRRYLNCLKQFDKAVAISKSVATYTSHYLPQLTIHIIPNGVTDIPETLQDKLTVRKLLNINQSKFIFLVVGSLSTRKDPLIIIEAFKKAFPISIYPNCELLFIGKGNLKNECEKKIKNDKRIKLLGWQAKVYDYLRAADWSISASHSEGFGLNFIESLIVGTPIVSTFIQAFDEFIPVFPELADFRFLPGDVEDLSNKLLLAYNSNVDRDILIEQAKKHYSSQIMADRYQNIYQDDKVSIQK